MKPARFTATTLVDPRDYLEFTHRGVHFFRKTRLHERGVYKVTVTAVADRGIKIAHHNNFRDAGGYANLIDAAEGVATFDATMYTNRRRHAAVQAP